MAPGAPEGAAAPDVALLDDGTPAAFAVDDNPFDGARLAGRLPPRLDQAGFAQAMGVTSPAADVVQGIIVIRVISA